MVYAITWAAFLPAVLQGWGLLELPVDLTGGLAFNAVVSVAAILGVALPAFLVTAATGGEAGVRDLLGRCLRWRVGVDRKSTRLNSSHANISYAVFCLKKKI